MNSDSYFEIGTTHLVCQDYALHGQIDDTAYAVVADGCSEAPHSEIGAQILCHVAQYYVNLFHHTGVLKECSLGTLQSLFANSILTRADEIRKLYPIDRGALQATLLLAVTTRRSPHGPGCHKTMVFAWGDGFIIERREGYTIIHELNFPSGAPVYLVTDPVQYRQKIDDLRCIYRKHTFLKMEETREEHEIDLFGGFVHEYMPKDPLVNLTLCSDGLRSYQDKDLKPIELWSVVPEVVNYKSDNGVFVQRCMNFMKIASKKAQRTHYDDMSTAAILL